MDIANLFTNGISTVNDEIFEDLTFGNNVVYNGNIESGGLLDGINFVDLARDLVVNGPSIVVNSDVTITGTNSSEITFGSVKVLSVAPTVTGSVVPFVENGEVFPTVVFKPCTRTSPVPGLLEGILSNRSVFRVSVFQERTFFLYANAFVFDYINCIYYIKRNLFFLLTLV